MRSLKQIQKAASQFYFDLKFGPFFNTYHDLLLSIVDEINMLEEEDDEIEYATKLLLQCAAIIDAQKILLEQNIK